MPVRIYDISKRLGLENKVVLAKAKELGITAARVASSMLDKITAEYLEQQLVASFSLERIKGLRSFQLANFKAFAEAQSIPIRPLTLIFGANSSGKSSVIHGLLLAREGVDTGKLDISKTEVGGDAVDLGGFRQYVHRRDANQQVEWSAELRTESLQGNAYAVLGSAKRVKVGLFFGIPLDDKGRPQRASAPRLVTYEIEADGRLLIRLNHRADGSMQVVRLDLEAFQPMVRALLVSATTTESVRSDDDEAAIKKAVEELVPTLRFECERLLPERLIGPDKGGGTVQQLVAIRRENRGEQLASAATLFIPRAIAEVVSGVNAELRSELERVVYLGPLRSFPPRHLAFVEENDRNWFAGGGYAWDELRTNPALRVSVNRWLSDKDRLQTPYRLVVERLFTASEVLASLEQGFESLAPDIVARLLGDVGTVGFDPAVVINARDEIDHDRAELKSLLAEKRQIISQLSQTTEVVQVRMANAQSRRQKVQLQRDMLVHGARDEEGVKHKLEAVQKELSTLEKDADDLKSTHEVLLDQHRRLQKEEVALVEREKELDKKRAEVFSAFQSTLDGQELAKRLFEVIGGRADRGPVDELMLVDCRTETPVTHRDVGIGVSQVLPVLVHAYADKGKIVAIEQPEIHLHPALQAELGDVFIESALGERKNTFILETHSEHLILRILRRVRESTEKQLPDGATPVRPEDITVVFVEPTAKGSVIKHLPVTPDGDFGAPWPGGFFADRLADLP